MTLVLLFLAQFAMVNLLALQSRFVRDSQYALAFGNSVLLGICGLYITPILANSDNWKQSPALLLAYLIAGPLAVCSAIWMHDRHVSRRQANNPERCKE